MGGNGASALIREGGVEGPDGNKLYPPDFKLLNEGLRNPHPDTLDRVDQFRQEVETSIKLLPQHVGTVYRGVGELPDGVIAQYQPGAILTEAAFVSTSTDLKVVQKFSPTTVFIDETYNGRVLDAASYFGQGEAEVLFPPNTKWQVLKVVEGQDLNFFESLGLDPLANKPRTAVQRIVYRREIPT